MLRTSVDKIHKSSTAIKLSKKNSSVSLRFRTLDPLQTRSNTTIFTATFAKNSATITTHPHFQQPQIQKKSIKSEEGRERERIEEEEEDKGEIVLRIEEKSRRIFKRETKY